jgi:hypothetical protein
MNTIRWTLSAQRDARYPLVLHTHVGILTDHDTPVWAGYLTLTATEYADLSRRLTADPCVVDDDFDLHNRHPQPGDPAEPLPPDVEGYPLGGRNHEHCVG